MDNSQLNGIATSQNHSLDSNLNKVKGEDYFKKQYNKLDKQKQGQIVKVGSKYKDVYQQVVSSSPSFILTLIKLSSIAFLYLWYKISLEAFSAPAYVLALHSLASVVTILILKLFHLVDLDLKQIRPKVIQSCYISTLTRKLQELFLFGSLLNGGVYMVLSWASVTEIWLTLIISYEVIRKYRSNQVVIPNNIKVPLALCTIGGVIEIWLNSSHEPVVFILLTLWFLAKGCEIAYSYLRTQPYQILQSLAPGTRETAMSAIETSWSISESNQTLIENTICIVPLVILGSLSLEFREFHRTNISTKKSLVLVLSCVCYSCLSIVDYLIEYTSKNYSNGKTPKMPSKLQMLMMTGGAIGITIILDIWEHYHEKSVGAFFGVVLCVASSFWCRSVILKLNYGPSEKLVLPK